MPGWRRSMEAKKMKHNIAACWTAIIINPIWLIVDYFSAPNSIGMIAAVDLSVNALILLMVLNRKKIKLNASAIGVITISILSVSQSFISCQLQLEEYQHLMISHTAIFIGAGMLILMEMKHSILTVAISIIVNIICYSNFSNIEINQYLMHGALLVLIVAVFMIISIQIRYRLTSRGVNSKLILKSNQRELIKAKQVAEKSNEMQSQFLSNMSHEIRTPMNGIMGITRILEKTDMDEEQRHYLNTIIQSSENLMVIINDVLDFSKIEAGKVILEHKRFNLDKLLEVVKEILATSATDKGLSLEIIKDDNVPTWLNGDSVRMNQILTNLISNGIKFTEHGSVKTHISLIDEADGKVQLKFEIIDTGIGIAPEKLDSIFQSFTQASASTTRTHGGTGLGLTITRQLVELQNGFICVDSELGKGSTFSFVIGYEIAENGEEIERNLKGIHDVSNNKILQELNGINILLVEDHPINQMLAIKVLEDWGFNVDLAENGLISLDKVGKKDYDLILMDISMPEMDGLTATENIRSGKYTNNVDVPIIAMTASALTGESQKCFDVGMNGYISKPFDPQSLLEKIYTHVEIKFKRA